MRLYTFGHGANDSDAIAELVRQAGLSRVVDVRTVPKSRRHPHFAGDEIARWLPAQTDAAYRWEPALGGFRRPSPSSPNTALRHPSFRGYADYMMTQPFRDALDLLMAEAGAEETAAMCSETLWWRCHRRLIADAATLLRGAEVLHLAPRGKPRPHVPTDGVRVAGDLLVYDGASP